MEERGPFPVAVTGVACIVLVILLMAVGSMGLGVIIVIVSACLLPVEAGIEAVKALAHHPWAPLTRTLVAILYGPGWAVAVSGGALIALAGLNPTEWAANWGTPGRILSALGTRLSLHWGLAPHPAALRLAERWAEANMLVLAILGALWVVLLVVNALEHVLQGAGGRPVPVEESLAASWARTEAAVAAERLHPIPSEFWIAANLEKARVWFRAHPREARYWLKGHHDHPLVRDLGDVFLAD